MQCYRAEQAAELAVVPGEISGPKVSQDVRSKKFPCDHRLGRELDVLFDGDCGFRD